ncbi:leucine-rich repeat protein [Perkinsela sp. CCAP 1560/4]|nr:leucine-rich repeat protein [Perkinsela sp. CCAP 1560/4]|eukprot:KNH09687.1 leucine-rich repeat protein [Perkinsela sp. CCAP 1560/4]
MNRTKLIGNMFPRGMSIRRIHTVVKGPKTVSYLDNGMRIMTYDDTRAMSAVGVFISVGIRCETDKTIGCSAIYDKFIFQSNKKINSENFAEDLSFTGNCIAVSNHRECASYTMQCPTYYVPQATEMLAAALTCPSFDNPKELDYVKNTLIEQIPLRARDPTSLCFELLHQAAFGETGLGRNAHFQARDIQKVSAQTMADFVQSQVRPDRIAVVASGISNHAEYVKTVQKCFEFPATTKSAPLPSSTYVGGMLTRHNTDAPESFEKFAEKELTHMSLFYPAPTVKNKDVMVVAVIQCLLGGGQSFSSGGPGKGMLTKLYREVVSQEGWMNSIECVTAAYTDAGLLGIYGSAPHENNEDLLRILTYQIGTISHRITEYHVDMAKNLLLSQMFLVNDTTMGQLEEAGRYLLLFDRVTTYDETVDLINAVTYDDVCRVSSEIIQGKPTLAVFGNTHGLSSNCGKIHNQVVKASKGKAV